MRMTMLFLALSPFVPFGCSSPGSNGTGQDTRADTGPDAAAEAVPQDALSDSAPDTAPDALQLDTPRVDTAPDLVPDTAAVDTGIACRSGDCGVEIPGLAAEPFVAAEALFHQEADWLGGDVASSVALGNGRVAWLFGDSFIATSDKHVRSESVMVRNSVAVQTGLDPTTATMAFAWDKSQGEKLPRSFFAEDGDFWFWPGTGVLVQDRLLVFVSRIKGVEGGLGFAGVEWDARLVSNPQDPPGDWQVTDVDAPANDKSVYWGGGGVFVDEVHVVAFGFQEPSHDLYIARWLTAAAREGDLSGIEWWCGTEWGTACPPAVVLEDIATEFSVHQDAVFGCWMMLYQEFFGATSTVVRWAPHYTGPWSGAKVEYNPPEQSWPNAFQYAGKAHPELAGGDILATYAVNSFDFATLINDTTYYYPRVVRLTRECPEETAGQ
ncbi:MAG: DUF4185 domain-containing protein [Deltaproteobacteria bacterium]|nr:DUF4185 domain-containing protein [Deltaproteobacteria bacterium]